MGGVGRVDQGEGGEGGGFKNPQDVASMVLLPLVRSKVDVPIIAAGGLVDGRSMAAAFALGAEGIQLGTRMVSAAESPVHDNWKQAVVDAAETDTVFDPASGSHMALAVFDHTGDHFHAVSEVLTISFE